MKDYHEPNPLIGFLKARMQGASVEEAFGVMGRLCDEANGGASPEQPAGEEALPSEVTEAMTAALHEAFAPIVQQIKDMNEDLVKLNEAVEIIAEARRKAAPPLNYDEDET